MKSGFFSNLKQDLPASIVVFLVALPLCLGIALASGAPLFSGIIAGIVGGTIVALLSGSPLGVSGPAAGLAIIVLNAIQDLGAYETFLLAVVLGGAIQLGLGFARAGVIGYYFPNSVIRGMLSGIGIIIFLKQIPHAFGYDDDPEGDFAFSQVDGHNTLSEIAYTFDSITPGALIIAVLSLAILIIWETPFMKKMTISRIIQGPLLVVLMGVGLNMAFAGNEALRLDPIHLVTIPVAGSFSSFLGQFTAPDFSQIFNMQVWTIAATLAIVASLETLLCVEATDKLDPHKRVTPTNRELKAQGVGNIISGLIGGLPVTQVIVRSSANIQSGGQSKASAFFHGLLLLISAISIPHLLNLIPLASLAAILLVVGYKLAKPQMIIAIYKQGAGQFIPFAITVLGIVFTDLLTGIGMGLVVAIMHILYKNYLTPYHFDAEDYKTGEPIKIQLAEHVSFLNKGGILHTLAQIPSGTHVIIDASRTKSIHPDVLEIIDDFEETVAVEKDIKVELIEIEDSPLHDPTKVFGKTMLNK